MVLKSWIMEEFVIIVTVVSSNFLITNTGKTVGVLQVSQLTLHKVQKR